MIPTCALALTTVRIISDLRVGLELNDLRELLSEWRGGGFGGSVPTNKGLALASNES
jgi:hypothetical protein